MVFARFGFSWKFCHSYPRLRQALSRYMLCFFKSMLNKKSKTTKDEKYHFQPKIYSFFQPLFHQCSSAHLQKAEAIPNAYFAKELIFSIAS